MSSHAKDRRSRRLASKVLLAVVLVLLPARAEVADFVRGDANGDGVVDLADAHCIMAKLFHGTIEIECLATADVDDSGRINLTDAVRLANSFTTRGLEPAAPYPNPGPDPSENVDEQPCEAYGGGEPLADPSAVLSILDAVTPGGANSEAVVTVALSTSRPLAAYQGTIDLAAGAVGGYQPTGFDRFSGTPIYDPPTDLIPPTAFESSPRARAVGDELRFSLFRSSNVVWGDWIEPGTDVPALELTVCVADGTPAGEYPISLVAGSLADAETGRRIDPLLVSGTLLVLEDVASGVECFTEPPDSEDCPFEEIDPSTLNGTFRLGDSGGPPGGGVDVPFSVSANAGVQGFLLSVDFDEGVLQALEVAPLYEKPDGTPWEFISFDINNDDVTPGNAGVDEGHISGAAVFSFNDSCSEIPADTETDVLRLTFQVASDAPSGPTIVRFLDGAQGRGNPITNSLRAGGVDVALDTIDSFLFVDALVDILADGSLFRRGDSNGDDTVDLSDSVETLDYLFLGTTRPRCLDAADADDSGKVELTDAVMALNFLYLGGPQPPPPYPELGTDPTVDALACGDDR